MCPLTNASWALSSPRGDGDGGVPRLLHADVLGLGGARPEARRAGGDLEVVRDVTLGAFAHDLGDADLVVASQLAQLVVGLDDARRARRASRD